MAGTGAWPLLRGLIARSFEKTLRPSHSSAHPSVFYRQLSSGTEHLPKIAQPSTWQSIVPKTLRNRETKGKTAEKKPRNPATYFIWIYLLIGSQAIRIIGVQNEFNTFTRRADLKIAKLKEVIEKLQKGEQVDVEKVLGAGDEAQELEWEDALREIEKEDRKWAEGWQKRREAKEQQKAEDQEASPVNRAADNVVAEDQEPQGPGAIRPPPGFY